MLKRIILVSSAVLAAVALTFYRVFVTGNYVDAFNGFIKTGSEVQGLIFAVVTLGVALVFVVITLFDNGFPSSPRRSSTALAGLNILYASALIIDCFVSSNTAEETVDVIELCLKLCVIGFVLYYSNCMFTQKKASVFVSVIPLVFFVFELAVVFINSFGIIKSPEVTLKIVSLIFCVLFFLFYARYISKFNFCRIRKVTYALGVCAGIFCAITAFGDILAPMFYKGVVSRNTMSENLLLGATSVYIFAFLIISSSNKRLYSAYQCKKAIEYISESIEEMEAKTDYVEDI